MHTVKTGLKYSVQDIYAFLTDYNNIVGGGDL
jgi:hypothetical protein